VKRTTGGASPQCLASSFGRHFELQHWVFIVIAIVAPLAIALAIRFRKDADSTGRATPVSFRSMGRQSPLLDHVVQQPKAIP